MAVVTPPLATELFDLRQTHNPHRWVLPVEARICVGPPESSFLFGGVGLAASIAAMERTNLARYRVLTRLGARSYPVLCRERSVELAAENRLRQVIQGENRDVEIQGHPLFDIVHRPLGLLSLRTLELVRLLDARRRGRRTMASRLRGNGLERDG